MNRREPIRENGGNCCGAPQERPVAERVARIVDGEQARAALEEDDEALRIGAAKPAREARYGAR